MQREYVNFLFDYSYWTRDRVLAGVAQLSPEQMLVPADLSYGGLLGVLTHILNAEYLWRTRCQQRVSPSSVPHETAVESLEKLKRQWQLLVQLVTHGIHHRAELAAHLATLGKTGGTIDFVIFAREIER